MVCVLSNTDGSMIVESFIDNINKTGYGETLEEAIRDMYLCTNLGYSIITIVKSEEDLRTNHPELFV